MEKNIPPERPFSVWRFAIVVGTTLTLFLTAFSLTCPTTWQNQLSASRISYLGIFILGQVTCCFAEWFFHRYILHAAPIGFLKRLCKQHTLHHALTTVRLVNSPDGKRWVFNRYPILEERQHEASYFPWYTLSGFFLFSLPFIIPLQIAFPTSPVILMVWVAITWSIIFYEIVHATEHLSYEKFWQKKIEHRLFGSLWQKFYVFHLRHHADIKANEGISGFLCGIPLADLILGTYAPWSEVFTHRKETTEAVFEARPPRPRPIVLWLDRIVEKRMAKASKQTAP
ncbi:MAG: hypothetical protein WC250_02365 [Candidatus Paceibacterota bacterium]|jgi:hemolysin III